MWWTPSQQQTSSPTSKWWRNQELRDKKNVHYSHATLQQSGGWHPTLLFILALLCWHDVLSRWYFFFPFPLLFFFELLCQAYLFSISCYNRPHQARQKSSRTEESLPCEQEWQLADQRKSRLCLVASALCRNQWPKKADAERRRTRSRRICDSTPPRGSPLPKRSWWRNGGHSVLDFFARGQPAENTATRKNSGN